MTLRFRFTVISFFILCALSSFHLGFAHQLGEKLFLDDSFTDAERIILQEDVRSLLEFPLEIANYKKLKDIIGSELGTSKEVFDWLQKWVHFVYPSYDSAQSRVFLTSREKSLRESASDDFFMLNLGLAKYLFTQTLTYQLGIVFVHDGEGHRVRIRTPAVGVVSAGENFFNSSSYSGKAPSPSIDPLAFRFFRIGTLLHEAAHSRGRGAYLGFAHVHCPADIPYYGGTQSCDASANGGNGVKASFLEAVIKACTIMNKSPELREEPIPLCKSRESLVFLYEAAQDCRRRILSQEFWDETPVLSVVDVAEVIKKAVAPDQK